MPDGTPRVLARLRKLCLALPEAREVEAWGEPTFRLGRKMFAMFAHGGTHHGNGKHAIWIKATAANQDFLVHSNPARFFVPPYMGPSGWIGVYLDGSIDWAELHELLDDGYRMLTPKRTRAALTPAGILPPASRKGRARS